MNSGPAALQAIVRDVRTTAAGRVADLSFDPVPACPRCAEGRGCGAGLFGRTSRKGIVSVPLAPSVELIPGQPVRLSLGERTLLGAALLVYGQPLAGAAIASVAAWIAGANDRLSVLAALAGLVAGIASARYRIAALDRAGLRILRIDA